MPEARVDFVLNLGVTGEVLPPPRAAVDFVFTLGVEAEQVASRTASVSFVLSLGVHEDYNGPGSGFVTSGDVHPVEVLRVGDRAKIMSFRTGLHGVSGVADVTHRQSIPDREFQELGLQVTPQPDPSLVPLLEGGDEIRGRSRRSELRKLGQR